MKILDSSISLDRLVIVISPHFSSSSSSLNVRNQSGIEMISEIFTSVNPSKTQEHIITKRIRRSIRGFMGAGRSHLVCFYQCYQRVRGKKGSIFGCSLLLVPTLFIMDKPGEVASEKLHLQTFENINKVSSINHVPCVKSSGRR